MSERKLIERIRRSANLAARTSSVIRGIGDDCAVLRVPPAHDTLVTTDFTLENVHFRRQWHSAEVVGHRCLARGLSDIASMGGEPLAAFLSLALPADLQPAWVDGFLKGFTALARKYAVQLAGGDLAQSPKTLRPKSASAKRTAQREGLILADVMVLGSAPRGKAILRCGAKNGDDIYVTGSLGTGVSTLNRLTAGERAGKVRADQRARKHFVPEPRLEVGRYLRERGLASSMIDISDGFSTDLAHICEESGVSAWIAEETIPVAPGATLADALHGGDEYELIFTARPQKHKSIPDRIGALPVTWVGTVTRSQPAARHRVWLVNNERGRLELVPGGWQHFE